MQLGRTDTAAILDFLVDIDELDDREPYSVDLLQQLRPLIPSAVISYQESDLRERRFTTIIADDVAFAGDAADIAADAADDELYWQVGPCPIADYRVRSGDLTTIRMSDVIGRSRYREQPIYREYFAPEAIEHVLDLCLAGGSDWYRSVVLLRERGEPDFSERDRAVMESLRPHLRAREARAALRRSLLEPSVVGTQRGRDADPPITAREREILALVAQGRTNAQIAAQLWVTPGTVKKHLENIYVKLGVGSRAAAASRVRSGG
jgi:DNA-binding CsgD family transcriptional regulator